MAIALSPEVTTEIRKLIDDACTNEHACLPCASVVVVGKGNNSPTELFVHSRMMEDLGRHQEKGNHTETTSRSTTGFDGIYWLASCTKLVTGIACMQLVEQGNLRLDDSDQVEKICPELGDVKVLREDGSLVDKKKRITLRMLLTHTAGFGYSFLNAKLRTYAGRKFPHRPVYDEFSGRLDDFLQPLVDQPGERFEYGINIDWAGIIIERVTHLKLNDYMQRYILSPLNIKDVSMFPSSHMEERLIGLWQRDANGQLSRRDYPLNRPLSHKSTTDAFHSGGAGLFGSIREYSKLLSALLNDGTSSETGRTILLPATVREMFTNQLPQHPDFARRHLPAVKQDLVYPVKQLYPLCPASSPQGWGITFMISPGLTGRSDMTAHWSGLSNIFWWCDRETGVAGIVASQVLPFADPKTIQLWTDVEAKVYQGLH